MKSPFFQTLYQNEDDRRVANILVKIIVALLTTYLIIIVVALLFWRDPTPIIITSVGGVLLIVPLGLLAHGHVRAGALIVVLSVLVLVTVLATIGQGIHDIAVIAYPVLMVIASLVMPRRDFFIASALMLIAMAWLVFGEAIGIFVSKMYDQPNASDFIVVAAIMLVAILAVDLLAEHMRRNLRQARQEIAQRKNIEEQLRFQSIHDVLTGLYNRAFFEEELSRLEHGREFPVSIMVADVDDLKIVNDTQGHATGDELLRHTANILRAVFRTSDIIARIGGDEFAVLLARTDAPAIDQMVSRVQAKLIEQNGQCPNLPVRISLGSATAEHGGLVQALAVADQSMYINKNARKLNTRPGSNQIELDTRRD